MEHKNEGVRLTRKTRRQRVLDQARWAGLRPGMRILDVGCGAGFTTSILAEVSDRAEGLDNSPERIAAARRDYPTLRFHEKNIYRELNDLGTYDFIWVRFFLEYHRKSSAELVKQLAGLLSAGGILCIGELDHHSLNHFPMSDTLQLALNNLAAFLQQHADWDPYIGRKLYTHMYDAGLSELDVRMDAHHLLFGSMESGQEDDWLTKLEVAAAACGYPFPEYAGGYGEFFSEAKRLLTDPRRFTYTPIILCRGIRPAAR